MTHPPLKPKHPCGFKSRDWTTGPFIPATKKKIRTNYFCKALQVNHAAVMEFRRCNAISSAAGERALGPCSLRNQEKDHDDHFKNSLDRRDRGRGHRIAGIGPVAQSRSWQRQCGGVQLRTDSLPERRIRRPAEQPCQNRRASERAACLRQRSRRLVEFRFQRPGFHRWWQRRLQSNAPAVLSQRKEGAGFGSPPSLLVLCSRRSEP